MTTTRWFSLRRRLLLLIFGGATACWLATMVLIYFDAHHEIDELLDAQMVQAAQTLLALAADDDEHDLEASRIGAEYQKRIKFQIWNDDGRLVLRSPNAPTTPLTATDGFSDAADAEEKHREWRYYSEWSEERGLRVQIGENDYVREELIGHITWRLLLPALLGLPLLGAWAWLAMRSGLEPLDAIAEQIGARAPDQLDALAPQSAPTEIRPLLKSLNNLFGRVARTMENERRFTADAAHELRTPLAALSAQAQVALRARDEAERTHALEQLSVGMARAGRLVGQLLTLARLDPQQQPDGTVRVDRLAEDVCADHGTLALARNIALELDAAPLTALGDADLLRILLRNLVDNAIRYTPNGGKVLVTVAAKEDQVRLAVADTGPGIPPAEYERVFERFSRLAGQETEGSGLGLSIVRRIADLHGARVTLAPGPNQCGLEVSVCLRGAATTAADAGRPGTS
ncbi:MAG: sensor histidine kinase N-terminal domain-containing protein [Rhodocyclales bacterium]|nr:sensor histidine kinase N-terminal domain-containing protein [Rhodocyclales bacterium]